MLKDSLRAIVKSQFADLKFFDYGIEREKLAELNWNLPFALILSGIRRCGKSTLLRQLMKKTGNFYYFNFDDNRAANFETGDFIKLDEIFHEEFGDSDFYFFDEIQNVEKWELFVRTMLDKKKHFVITGSNASLLSKELGTRLTGRHLRYELFPFSFKEFLEFTKEKPNIGSFEKYFCNGGFPEYLKYGKNEILMELLNDIIARDIVIRHKLRNIKTMNEMAVYLLSNVGKEFSYNSLKKTFKLGSINTVIAFTGYLEDSYLIFTVPRFDYSPKKQLVQPKKAYSIDNSMSNVNSFSFFSEKGRMLENIVFLQLRKKHKNIFYFKEKNECDFLIKEKNKITTAIQACYELTEDNKNREINGLIEALKKFKLTEGIILTYNQEDKILAENKKITVKPVWKWFLEKNKS